jgi:hypothetical protein
MKKLIDCKASILNSLTSNRAPRGFRTLNSRRAPAEEPLHVHVRVRQHGAAVLEARQARSAGPELGRLPVGSLLDCYV